MSGNKYSIKITSQAEADLDGIYGYIVSVFFAVDTAGKAMDKIEHGIRRLCDMPYSAPLMDEFEYSVLGIHKLVAEQYNIFYLVNEEKKQVEIIHVLHGKQDYTKKIVGL
jgi:plasmid stabilization system protein ParE